MRRRRANEIVEDLFGVRILRIVETGQIGRREALAPLSEPGIVGAPDLVPGGPGLRSPAEGRRVGRIAESGVSGDLIDYAVTCLAGALVVQSVVGLGGVRIRRGMGVIAVPLAL